MTSMKHLPLSGEIGERVEQGKELAKAKKLATQERINEKSKAIAVAVSTILTDAEKTSELLLDWTETGFTYLTWLDEGVIKKFEQEDGFVLTAWEDKYFVPTEIAQQLADEDYVFKLEWEDDIDISDEDFVPWDEAEQSGWAWVDKIPELKVEKKPQELDSYEDCYLFESLLTVPEKKKFDTAKKYAPRWEHWVLTAEKAGFYSILQLAKKQKNEKLSGINIKPRKEGVPMTDSVADYSTLFEHARQGKTDFHWTKKFIKDLWIALKAKKDYPVQGKTWS